MKRYIVSGGLDLAFASEQIALAAVRLELLVKELDRYVVDGQSLRTHEIQHRAQTAILGVDAITTMLEDLIAGDYDAGA